MHQIPGGGTLFTLNSAWDEPLEPDPVNTGVGMEALNLHLNESSIKIQIRINSTYVVTGFLI